MSHAGHACVLPPPASPGDARTRYRVGAAGISVPGRRNSSRKADGWVAAWSRRCAPSRARPALVYRHGVTGAPLPALVRRPRAACCCRQLAPRRACGHMSRSVCCRRPALASGGATHLAATAPACAIASPAKSGQPSKSARLKLRGCVNVDVFRVRALQVGRSPPLLTERRRIYEEKDAGIIVVEMHTHQAAMSPPFSLRRPPAPWRSVAFPVSEGP